MLPQHALLPPGSKVRPPGFRQGTSEGEEVRVCVLPARVGALSSGPLWPRRRAGRSALPQNATLFGLPTDARNPDF